MSRYTDPSTRAPPHNAPQIPPSLRDISLRTPQAQRQQSVYVRTGQTILPSDLHDELACDTLAQAVILDNVDCFLRLITDDMYTYRQGLPDVGYLTYEDELVDSHVTRWVQESLKDIPVGQVRAPTRIIEQLVRSRQTSIQKALLPYLIQHDFRRSLATVVSQDHDTAADAVSYALDEEYLDTAVFLFMTAGNSLSMDALHDIRDQLTTLLPRYGGDATYERLLDAVDMALDEAFVDDYVSDTDDY